MNLLSIEIDRPIYLDRLYDPCLSSEVPLVTMQEFPDKIRVDFVINLQTIIPAAVHIQAAASGPKAGTRRILLSTK